MTNGFHAADDGSLARSTGGAAARGALLIALAIVIGLLLLTFALNDSNTEIASADDTEQSSDDAATGDDAESDNTDNTDETTVDETSVDAVDPGAADADLGTDAESIPTDTIDPATVRPPSEVNVLVANGVGTAGIAGSTADVLVADGYIGVPADAPNTPTSVIIYKEGFDAEARAVAESLGAPPDIIQAAAADGSLPINQNAIDDGRAAAASIIVILGADGVIPTS